MSKTSNLRWDPIDQKFIYTDIDNEIHECIEIPELNGIRFGFRLDEVPEKRVPSSTLIITEVEWNEGTETWDDVQVFTEVLGNPGPNQFYSNYHDQPLGRDGLIILPASNIGKFFKARYEGMGTVNSFENQKFVQEIVFETLLKLDGSRSMIGHLDFGNMKGINIAAGVAGNDVARIDQIKTRNYGTTNTAFSEVESDLEIDLGIPGKWFLFLQVTARRIPIIGLPDYAKPSLSSDFVDLSLDTLLSDSYKKSSYIGFTTNDGKVILSFAPQEFVVYEGTYTIRAVGVS